MLVTYRTPYTPIRLRMGHVYQNRQGQRVVIIRQYALADLLHHALPDKRPFVGLNLKTRTHDRYVDSGFHYRTNEASDKDLVVDLGPYNPQEAAQYQVDFTRS